MVEGGCSKLIFLQRIQIYEKKIIGGWGGGGGVCGVCGGRGWGGLE